jgi:pimeloyl-ACP methyl ester carboxylesterase
MGDRGPAVVLLHSSAASGRQWDVLASVLQSRFRVHAVDLHGHGSTPAWQGDRPLSLDDEAALVEPLLAAAPGGVHLVGHSYGGAVALKVAHRLGAHVRSVAVYEPVLFRLLFDYNRLHAPAREVAAVAQSVDAGLAAGAADRAAQRFVDYWSGAGTWDAMPHARRQSLVTRTPAVAPHFRALFTDSMTRADLARLPMPVLCLTGARTRASTRRIGELLRMAMRHARHEMLPGLGHMGPVTHAAEVAVRLAAFVESHAVRDARPHLAPLRAAA